MSRARVLADRANQNTLAVDTTNSEVGIATSVPNSTLDVLGEVRVGSAIQAGVAGVVTATSFSGSGANLTGLATTETVRTDTITVAGVSTFTGVANFSAAVNADATTDSTSVSTGALIVDGGLGVAKNVYIGAGLSVAGTLTYEDVTNVDSVGLITAKSGVNVSGGQLAVGVAYSVGAAGVATAAGFVGGTISGTTGTFSGAVSGSTGTFTGDVDIADKIVHTGDTNTAIRFPSADTVTVETGGSERVRVASNGRVGVGTASPRAFLDLYGAAENATLLLESNDANANLCLMDDSGSVRFLNYGGELALRTGGTGAFTGDNERVRITSAGRLGIGITNPSSLFEVAGATPQIRSTDTDAANDYSVFQNSSGNSVYNAVDNNSAGGHIFQANATEVVRITSAGNLGVGDNSPDVRLHVTETVDVAYTVDTAITEANNLLKLENPSTTAEAFAGMQFRVGSGADMFVGAIQQSANAGDLYVVNQNNPNKEIVRLKSTGVVGIATTNPQTTLHIQEASEPTVSLWEGGTKRSAFQAQSSGTYIYSYQDNPLIFSSATGTAFSEKLRIGTEGLFSFNNGELVERVNITAGKLSDNTNINLSSGMVHYFTTQESTTSTPNIRSSASATLNSLMDAGDVITVTLVTTAAAGGYSAHVTIDGTAVTEEWVGGSAPSAGGSDGLDIYVYTIICTHASNTGDSGFKVIANYVNATN